MTKIAIISQPEQGVLIDIGGCGTLNEATQHLVSTLQVSSEFWDGQDVDLNLGNLILTSEELLQVLSIMSERGIKPRFVFAKSSVTKKSLEAHKIRPAVGSPASLLADGTIFGGTPQPDTVSGATDKSLVSSNGGIPDESTAADNVMIEEQAAASAPLTSGTDHDGGAPDECLSPSSATTEAGCSDSADDTDAKTEGASAIDSDSLESESEAGTPPEGASDQPKAPVVSQVPAQPPVPHVLYLRQNLRSGQAISHKGHLVIVGDVNPGAEVMADGDITIWGALRGVAHAGVSGNTNAEIRALKFDPIQLRIAQAIARSPDRPKVNLKTNGPETARIVNGIIRISSSAPE